MRSVDGSKTWADPLVGVQLRTPENDSRWHAQVYTETGGFGAGSTFTWQVFPTFGVNLAKWVSIEFGYRWLDIDYSTGADLGNSFAVVQEMRPVPFTWRAFVHLAVATLLPVAPLLLTMFSLEQLLGQALKMLF